MGRGNNRFVDLVNKKKKQETEIADFLAIPPDYPNSDEKEKVIEKNEGGEKIGDIVKGSELESGNDNPAALKGQDQENEPKMSLKPINEVLKTNIRKIQNSKSENKAQSAGLKKQTTHLKDTVLKQAKVAILTYDLKCSIEEITEQALVHYINVVLPKRKN